MAKGLIWATAEDLAKSRGRVLCLYRQILRSLNSPDLPLNYAARLARKAEARSIFVVAAEERSIHNIEDLISTGDYRGQQYTCNTITFKYTIVFPILFREFFRTLERLLLTMASDLPHHHHRLKVPSAQDFLLLRKSGH